MEICPKSTESGLQNAKDGLYKMLLQKVQPEEKIRSTCPKTWPNDEKVKFLQNVSSKLKWEVLGDCTSDL